MMAICWGLIANLDPDHTVASLSFFLSLSLVGASTGGYLPDIVSCHSGFDAMTLTRKALDLKPVLPYFNGECLSEISQASFLFSSLKKSLLIGLL